MSDDEPRDYDREYERDLPGPLRERIGRDTDSGDVTRFVVQLEYYHRDEWRTVVRYDHDSEGEFGHDVTEDGLHIDIYRDGKKYRSEFVTPPLPSSVALDHAEDHLVVAQALSPHRQRVPQSAPADKERSRVGIQRRHHPLRQRYNYSPNAH